MNIIFAGTPEFSVPALEKLHEAGHNIDLVITQQDRRKGRGKKLQPTPVKEKALELGLEVFQPSNINSKESLDYIKSFNPDVIVVIAYGQIFKEEVLNLPKYGCINIHASLLPKYRGAAPINWVLINGEDETGVTIMQMEKGLDTGDMYYKKKIAIKNTDDSEDIHDKLSSLGAEAIVESLEDIISGKLKGEKQDDSKSSYSPMIYKETGHIDWNKNAEDIYNLIRGVKPWPGAFSIYEDENMKIHDVEILEEKSNNNPGEIIQVSDSGVKVSSKDKMILIKELQFPNKRRMKVEEYILGNKIEEGIILK